MHLPIAPENPKVSIIMRAKNSDWVIGQALAGLFSQKFTDFELLVIDSGSTDNTLDIVAKYPCRLIEIEAGDYYPGNVLNMAIAEAKADIVVFQNSDSVPLGPHSLGELVAAFDNPEVMGAFARQIPRPEADTWVRCDYAISFPAHENAPDWITLSLPLAAMRREAWEQHPFYNDAWGSEDTEWGLWARNEGLIVKYVPTAITMHSHNYTLNQVYGRRFIEGEADAFIYKEKDSLFKLIKRTLSSILRDGVRHVRALDWVGLMQTPARRMVYQWAYYKGHKLGETRIASGNTDTSLGQQAVLQRYDK